MITHTSTKWKMQLWLLLMGCIFSTSAQAAKNVLFIAIDDLRPELNSYGAEHIQSPNLDSFAKNALQFNRAYCQQAVCNPSRSSLMTGMRPETIGVTGNHVHFREKLKDVVTLPQFFKEQGYHAEGIGKIYHGFLPDGTSKTVWDTLGDPESWSVPATRFGPRYYYTEEGIASGKLAYQNMYKPENPEPDDWTKKLVFGNMTEAPDVEDSVLFDGKVTKAAIEALRERAAKPDENFFLGVGYIKPHTPFVAPKKYWDLYDPKEIEIAKHMTLPEGAPKMAGHGSGEVRRYTDQPRRGEFTEANQRNLKHGYYACISYIDAQVGQVLAELERLGLAENTVVVVFADHGWHLGEQGLWGKTTNYELDARVPLLVRAPGMKASGMQSSALVELLDLYPTLVELTGFKVPDHLEGKSFVPLFDTPDLQWKDAVLTQYPRGGNANLGGKNMGYSLRTDRWRYIEWIENETGKIVARELYDHNNDSGETVNVAMHLKNFKTIKQLSERLSELRNRNKGDAP